MRLKRISLAIVVLSLIASYSFRAAYKAEVGNTDRVSSDQNAYISYARDIEKEGFFTKGDGNRMPLYPWVQSLFYDPQLGKNELFRRGKFVNIGLSLLLLAAIGAVTKRRLTWLPWASLMLIIAFTVFIFKAPYYQPELLFYTLNLGAYLLMLELLRRPDWRMAIAAGIVLALAQLTKASELPTVVLFVFWGCVGAIVALRRSRAQQGAVSPESGWRVVVRYLLPIMLTIVVFLGVISPQLVQNKRVFGHYWYNVNSTFYMWYDSWEEAKEGTRAHGDRRGWPDMPADQIPSPLKYLREHTPRQIAERLSSGLVYLEGATRHSYGYYKYVVIYALAMLGLLASSGTRRRAYLRERAVAALFWASSLAMWALLCAWYVPIARGTRFILGQFMPFLVPAAYALHAPELAPAAVTIRGRRVDPIWLFDVAMLLLASFDTVNALTRTVMLLEGGD